MQPQSLTANRYANKVIKRQVIFKHNHWPTFASLEVRK
jgi:hypothetical protein